MILRVERDGSREREGERERWRWGEGWIVILVWKGMRHDCMGGLLRGERKRRGRGLGVCERRDHVAFLLSFVKRVSSRGCKIDGRSKCHYQMLRY